jgi:hypothetical protein
LIIQQAQGGWKRKCTPKFGQNFRNFQFLCFKNLGKRLVKTPKLYFYASGHAAYVNPGDSAETQNWNAVRIGDSFPTAIALLDMIQRWERENSPGDQAAIGVWYSPWQCDCHG